MKKLMICLAILFTVATMARAEFYTFGTEGGAYDMTDDGSLVVGLYNGEIALWTVDGGLVPLAMGDFNGTPFVSISGDGTTVAASLENPKTLMYEAAKWTEAGGWELLGGLPGGGSSGNSMSTSWGINGDGSTMVGLGWQDAGTAVAMQWTAAGGAGLIQTANDESSRASGVSADGSTIVGWYGAWEGDVFHDRRPTRWVDGGAEDVFLGHMHGEATNTNADGSMIIGHVNFDGAWNKTAFKYTDADGVTDLGLLVPDIYGTALSIANDVSEDGTVVGWSGDDWAWDPEGLPVGVVWLPDGTGIPAHDYLESMGVTVELPPGGPMGDWRIRSVMSISDDGSILCGTATNPMREFIGWYAVIPAQTLKVTVTGSVEWNQVNFGVFADVAYGDPVTMTFEVTSDNYLDSPSYPTRGYTIDQDSYTLTVGSATVSLADPYPDGQVPYFVLSNDDPVSDGFFIASNNVDWPWPGLPLNEAGVIGEPFESHFDVGYEGDTLTSLDIRDAVGIYTYDGLTRFYFNVVDMGMEPIGLEFTQFEISVVGPFDASIDCLTPVMALPDMGGFQVDLTSNSDTVINVGAHVDVTLCNGVTYSNVRAGNTVLGVGETYTRSWTMPIPALATTCGCDLIWTVVGYDTTTLVEDVDSCTVTTTCE